VVADVVVGGIAVLASRVADAGGEDTVETPEPGVAAPESPDGEDGDVDLAVFGGRRRAGAFSGFGGTEGEETEERRHGGEDRNRETRA